MTRPLTILPALGLLLLTALPQQALAWGSDGHRMIGALAIKALPRNVPAFLRTGAASDTVGYLAPEPDRIRGAGTVADKDLEPGHFVDANDDLTVLGGPALKALPATREDYDTALRAVNSDQYKAGYLPYSILAGYEIVRKDLALWRLDIVGARYAPSAQGRAGYAKDRLRREAETLHDIGIWAHFVGDGSQPLHVSVHYNGWGNYPNPQGFTLDHIHSPFETDYVHANVRDAAVAAAMPALRDCACAVTARVSDYLIGTAVLVAPLYSLQKAGAFAVPTQDGTAFAVTQIARGAAELRDLIAMAWKESDDTMVGYPGIKVSDIEAGKTAALAALHE